MEGGREGGRGRENTPSWQHIFNVTFPLLLLPSLSFRRRISHALETTLRLVFTLRSLVTHALSFRLGTLETTALAVARPTLCSLIPRHEREHLGHAADCQPAGQHTPTRPDRPRGSPARH